MTEIVARLPRPRADRLLLPAVVAAAVLAAALLVLLGRVAADHVVSPPRPTARARALHVRVDLRASRRLTFGIRRAELHGRHRRVQLLEARRRSVDRRFLAATSLRATVAYLEQARRVLGSRDLAVAAYHIGLRALRNVVAGRRLSYARLYFGSAPDRHPRVWHKLHALGGDYYWRVLAAKRIMRLYSSDYDVLAYEARQQARKSSAE